MIKQELHSIKIVWFAAKKTVICKIIQSIVSSLLIPLNLYLVQRLLNSVEQYIYGTVGLRTVLLFLVFLMGTVLLIANTGFLDNILKISIQRSLNEKLGADIVRKFVNIEYGCFEDKEVADTLNRMGAEPQTKILNIFYDTINAAAYWVSILGTALIFMQVSVWFSIAFLILLMLMIFFDYHAMKIMNTLFNEQSEDERRLEDLSELLESKHSLLELKIFMAADYILGKWKKLNKKVLDERVKMTVRSQKYYAVSTLLFILWAAFLIFSLILGISNQTVNVGIFVALIGTIGTVLELSQSLSRLFLSISKQSLEILHYDTFMDLAEEVNVEYAGEMDYQNPHIVFDDVCFAYPKTENRVLNHFSMEILPSQKVAFVGANGAGKSTIIKLLCRLYRPDSGRITINGVDINCLSREQIGKMISVVFQDYVSYALTLRENVAFGDISKKNDDTALEHAMQEGMAQPILQKLKDGLNSSLGKLEETGVDLSGGEWQRIAIARACLADSGLVILDEPTAALDPVAESEMYESFSSMLKNRGCVMISHRLGSAKMADKIYVLDKGTVAECGTHSELMEKKGLYESMFQSQSSWYQINP